MQLIIGNKNYSSWSVRSWLLLVAFEVPFEEIRIPLYQGNWRDELAKYSGAGKVPVLQDNGFTVWDSLAICEYISEQYLDGRGWPEETAARAEARSICAEMHSGFFAIRENMPMNCRAVGRHVAVTDAMSREIGRIDQIWSGARNRYSGNGPWLFGGFSIADCVYAPIVFRFNTYGVTLSGPADAYMKTVLSHPAVERLFQEAKNETEVIDASEVGL